jgi:hypothetical protein
MALCPFQVWAQDATGTVAGVVTDPAAAVVPKATVTVTNTGTKSSQQTLTDANGFYEVRH